MEWLPQEISGGEKVFGARRIDDLLPRYDEIPEEFKGFSRSHKWIKVAEDWFYNGLKGGKARVVKGIDADAAWAHLSACLASWEPSQERKIAGVAYLMSLWFEDVQYDNDSGA